MRITIDIETDHPDAYDHLRADLAGLVTGLADDGKPGATWVRIREAVFEGMATRREWIGERDEMDEMDEDEDDGTCTHAMLTIGTDNQFYCADSSCNAWVGR